MPTPTSPSLKEHAAAFVKSTAWGTALPVGATNGLTILNDGGLQLRRAYQPLDELDAPVHKGGDLDVNDAVDFSPTFICRHGGKGQGTLLASFYGLDTMTSPGTTAKLHTLKWQDNIRGKHGTFCVERPGKVYEVPSVKVMGFDFTLTNGRLVGTANLRGNDVKDDSAINSATQMDAVTASPFNKRLRWKEGAVRMNAEGGATLVGATPLQVNALDISIKRAFDAEHALGASELIEPEENGIDEVTIRLGFPRFDAANAAFFSTGFKDEALQKMMITFKNPVAIETTYYPEWNFYFPSLQIVEFIPGPQGGVVPAAMLLRARQAETAPTGMSETRHYLTLQNTDATEYLA